MMYFGSIDHPDFLIPLRLLRPLLLQTHCLQLLLNTLLLQLVFILPQVLFDELVNSHFVDLILRDWRLIDVTAFGLGHDFLVCYLYLGRLIP